MVLVRLICLEMHIPEPIKTSVSLDFVTGEEPENDANTFYITVYAVCKILSFCHKIGLLVNNDTFHLS